ncbi:MAG: SDR family NAD(P)-dependent oxidoreductase [Mycolicibacterium sp.]|nr:SDR family NAD(P)-dependent oxidoreductase [Mycolicibacterium sp.]
MPSGEAIGTSADVRATQPPKRPWRQHTNSSEPSDPLISGAAGNFSAAALRLSPNGFESIVDINLLDMFNVLRGGYRFLAKPGASVIHISAPQAVLPTITHAHVCAAKAGVDMLKVLALE